MVSASRGGRAQEQQQILPLAFQPSATTPPACLRRAPAVCLRRALGETTNQKRHWWSLDSKRRTRCPAAPCTAHSKFEVVHRKRVSDERSTFACVLRSSALHSIDSRWKIRQRLPESASSLEGLLPESASTVGGFWACSACISSSAAFNLNCISCRRARKSSCECASELTDGSSTGGGGRGEGTPPGLRVDMEPLDEAASAGCLMPMPLDARSFDRPLLGEETAASLSKLLSEDLNIGVADNAKNKVPMDKTRRIKKKQCLTFMMEMRHGFNDKPLLTYCIHRRVLKPQ